MPDEERLLRLREFVARAANVRPRTLLDRAAADVLAAFEAAGVPALLLKGPVLAQRLYRPGEQRDYLDIDILVAPARLDGARASLAALGFSSEGSEFAGVDDFLGVLDAESWTNSDGCTVDLHWRLPGLGVDPAAAWELLHASREPIVVDGREVPALGPAALALHVATHAAQSGPGDLKAIGDLSRAAERWPLGRWREAARLAAELSATEPLSAGLRLSARGASVAAQLGLRASPGLEWAIRHRESRPRGTFHVRGLIDAHGWRERAGIVRRSLLPRPEWIAAQSPWARRGRRALVAAYALHVVRSPLWALRAWRFDRRSRRAGEQGR